MARKPDDLRRSSNVNFFVAAFPRTWSMPWISGLAGFSLPLPLVSFSMA